MVWPLPASPSSPWAPLLCCPPWPFCSLHVTCPSLLEPLSGVVSPPGEYFFPFLPTYVAAPLLLEAAEVKNRSSRVRQPRSQDPEILPPAPWQHPLHRKPQAWILTQPVFITVLLRARRQWAEESPTGEWPGKLFRCLSSSFPLH